MYVRRRVLVHTRIPDILGVVDALVTAPWVDWGAWKAGVHRLPKF